MQIQSETGVQVVPRQLSHLCPQRLRCSNIKTYSVHKRIHSEPDHQVHVQIRAIGHVQLLRPEPLATQSGEAPMHPELKLQAEVHFGGAAGAA